MSFSDVWYAIPTADFKKCSTCFAKWQEKGYRTLAIVEEHRYEGHTQELMNCDEVIVQKFWQGYPAALAGICRDLRTVEIIVTGGDDVFPDSRPAEEIRDEFLNYFGGTNGVMQPTGDPAMENAASRICGSPWLGEQFRNEINGGEGPFWPSYYHFFCDQELQEVALLEGLLWQRPDLTQIHDHWSFKGGQRPEYMDAAQRYWPIDKMLFDSRKHKGFPGHERL